MNRNRRPNPKGKVYQNRERPNQRQARPGQMQSRPNRSEQTYPNNSSRQRPSNQSKRTSQSRDSQLKKRPTSNQYTAQKSNPKKSPKKAKFGKHEWFGILATVFVVLVFSIVVLFLSLGSARVVDYSMAPTIPEETKVFYKKTKDLGVGDVILMTSPDETRYEQIRRVIGLPGQKVDFLSDNSIVIDGVVLQETYFKEELKVPTDEKLNNISMKQFLEATPTVSESMVDADKIPENMVLVLGDARYDAFDSRNYGLVPFENIKGKAIISYWPLQRVKVK